MSADLLRRAAKAMRERARATQISEHGMYWYGEEAEDLPVFADILKQYYITATHHEDAEHIASWHPAVALAVADVLDLVGGAIADGTVSEESPIGVRCSAVARAYLGETS